MPIDWRKSHDAWCPACGSHYSGTIPNGETMTEIICKRCGEETVVSWQNRAAKSIKKAK